MVMKLQHFITCMFKLKWSNKEVYSSMLIQEKKNYLKISDVAFNFR